VGSAIVAALAAVTALSVQGCAPAGPADADSVAASHVVTIAKAQAEFATLTKNIDEAAAQANETLGLTYVTGAAYFQASAQYTAQVSESIPLTRYRYSDLTYLVPSLSHFPEWFAVEASRSTVTNGRASAPVETLLLFSRQKATLNWTLAGQTVLARKLPALAMDHGYVIPVSTTDPELLLRPDVVGATQAAVVDEGPSAPAASVVASGPQTDGLYAAQSAQARTDSAQHLQYTWLLQGSTFPQVGLRLRNGGALVLYGMYLNTTTQHPNLVAGSPIKVPAGFFPLFAAPTEVGYHAVYANWTYQYAAIDPLASTHGARLQVIAAQGSPTLGHAY
jgi:hypothetical protein